MTILNSDCPLNIEQDVHILGGKDFFLFLQSAMLCWFLSQYWYTCLTPYDSEKTFLQFSGFKCFLSALGQGILARSNFGFKESLPLMFKFGNCSAISHAVVVLVTIVTPHVGRLMILSRLTCTTSNRFTYFYYLLVVKQDSDRWCTWSSPSSPNAWNMKLFLHIRHSKMSILVLTTACFMPLRIHILCLT
jgi:hypothetical protein